MGGGGGGRTFSLVVFRAKFEMQRGRFMYLRVCVTPRFNQLKGKFVGRGITWVVAEAVAAAAAATLRVQ